MSYVDSIFQHFAGRNRPRPHSPEPSTENRNFQPSPAIKISPTTGPTSGPFTPSTVPYAPPEPSSSPQPVNMYGQPIPLDGPSDSARTLNPESTTAKGVPVYRPGQR